MAISVDHMNLILQDAAQGVTWQRSDMCPCRDPSSGAAQPGCPVCGGAGVLWEAPVYTRTALSGQKVQRQWAASELFEVGDVVTSIPSNVALYDIGENDRVVFIQSSEPFRSIFTHDGTDEPTFAITEVDRVFWLDPQSGLVVGGTFPVQDSSSLLLSWPDGAPPTGIQYTIRGRKAPTYYCFKDLAQDRAHYGGSRLPRKCTLRKFDLFGRGGP